MVEVDPDDPAFTDPTKFIGPVYEREEAERAGRREGLGDQARRRQVAARRRLAAARSGSSRSGRSRWLLERGAVVICTGGGGIPTMYQPGTQTLVGCRGGRSTRTGRARCSRERARGGPVRDGDRRRRGLPRLGHARAAGDRASRPPAELAGSTLAGGLDGAQGGGRGRLRRSGPGKRAAHRARSPTSSHGRSVAPADRTGTLASRDRGRSYGLAAAAHWSRAGGGATDDDPATAAAASDGGDRRARPAKRGFKLPSAYTILFILIVAVGGR